MAIGFISAVILLSILLGVLARTSITTNGLEDATETDGKPGQTETSPKDSA